jgi:hypothetical protein
MAKAKQSFPWHEVFKWGVIAVVAYAALRLLPTLVTGVGSAVNSVTSAVTGAVGSNASAAGSGSVPVSSSGTSSVAASLQTASQSGIPTVTPLQGSSNWPIGSIFSSGGPIPAKRWGWTAL